jgi:hypothetical protein
MPVVQLFTPIDFKSFRSDADKRNPSRQSRHWSEVLLRVLRPHSQIGKPLGVMNEGSSLVPPTPQIDVSSSLTDSPSLLVASRYVLCLVARCSGTPRSIRNRSSAKAFHAVRHFCGDFLVAGVAGGQSGDSKLFALQCCCGRSAFALSMLYRRKPPELYKLGEGKVRWFLPRCFGHIPPDSGGGHRGVFSRSVAGAQTKRPLLIR